MGPADSRERERLHAAKTCGQYIQASIMKAVEQRRPSEERAKQDPNRSHGGHVLRFVFFCLLRSNAVEVQNMFSGGLFLIEG